MTTTTSTTGTHATGTSPAVLPAAAVRMHTNPDTQELFADVLAGTRLSDYWPLLAGMLTFAVRDIYTAHAGECRRRDCRTCAAIRNATTWVAAHHDLNDNVCGCNPCCGHRHHIPHPTREFQP